MSRIGKKPIDIPSGVEVKIDGNVITVKGPKGSLTKEIHPEMIVKIENNQILVQRPSDERHHKALHGLTRTLIANMVAGVTKGYEKVLEIVGIGYRAQKQGKKLILNVGYSHPVEIEEPAGITIEVPDQNRIVVKGIDKQQVGNFAANIRKVREPDPYLGKGIKYADEVLRLKEGKAGKGGKK
ncbi:50S ribosomal protein L6 [Caldicellulosiruptor changbaiensis]|uniref:Large ribosomal subunit protein uL6 n=2 Tax=Caldicellulosiruptor TaxID=44000 RepID=RL6_CALS8|nr:MULTISPECIES: 50S ribosomal protein L6 [Caldicellulosiruptor]A4XLR5.1 RecName: Full=Large ribosomal subunit protein uL6; AltName: Full=50S ribosomal protein L6 [Caldicellulosiruptor saccharolyticus DSM 8903]ABP67850.1 ribosomal protein L6 [Caldicellulosiruptor saccharolyticus DSM 8903]AZT90014.1 50S ribosomal protein L6 [Caldicellulosiruptor changbaiensis]